MYISPGGFAEALADIRRTSISHSTCKIVLFVSCLDIDALCAAKILSGLFKAELIPHKIVPIVGYSELKSMYDQLDEEITNIICIGCGATIDLVDYFDIDEEEDSTQRKVYIIDNHRPWNLDNLFGSKSVVCFDDGKVEDGLSEHKTAYDFLSEDPGDDEDDGGDEDDEDEQNGNANGSMKENSLDGVDGSDGGSPGSPSVPSRATRQDTIPDSGDDSDDLDADRDLEPTQVDAQTQAINDAKKKVRRMRRDYTALLEDYYAQGSFLASSATTHIYTLLSLIGQTSVDYLWLTIVGVTSLDAQYPHIYSSLYPLLKDEVTRLCPPPAAARPTNSTSPATAAADDTALYIETDYSLFLLRHWSLYESMIHSSYLSAKLHLWTDDGRKKLHKLLAKMGIALQESRELWTHMQIQLKRSLKEKLASVAGMYGIEEVIRQGVVRRFGFKGSVSAGDCVEALAALLEAGSGGSLTSHPVKPVTGETDVVSNDLSSNEREKFWVANFWAGWDALDRLDMLMDGIAKAKALQQAIVSTGTALFEKRQIKDLRTFRLAVLREGPDLEIFTNPLALARLGVWIAEGCAEVHPQSLPLVVACYNEAQGVYLVLGMGPRRSRDAEDTPPPNDPHHNVFGAAFQTTADRISARVRIDAFESSIIQIAKDDLSRFLETLTLSGMIR